MIQLINKSIILIIISLLAVITGYTQNTSYNTNAIPISGTNCTAFGIATLFNNTGGANNAATGDSTLYSNTTGNENTAIGYKSLYSNTIGNLHSRFFISLLELIYSLKDGYTVFKIYTFPMTWS